MVDCPECGSEMKVGGHIGRGDKGKALYNCDNCGIKLYNPPVISTKLEKDTLKTEEKTPSKKKYK